MPSLLDVAGNRGTYLPGSNRTPSDLAFDAQRAVSNMLSLYQRGQQIKQSRELHAAKMEEALQRAEALRRERQQEEAALQALEIPLDSEMQQIDRRIRELDAEFASTFTNLFPPQHSAKLPDGTIWNPKEVRDFREARARLRRLHDLLPRLDPRVAAELVGQAQQEYETVARQAKMRDIRQKAEALIRTGVVDEQQMQELDALIQANPAEAEARFKDLHGAISLDLARETSRQRLVEEGRALLQHPKARNLDAGEAMLAGISLEGAAPEDPDAWWRDFARQVLQVDKTERELISDFIRDFLRNKGQMPTDAEVEQFMRQAGMSRSAELRRQSGGMQRAPIGQARRQALSKAIDQVAGEMSSPAAKMMFGLDVAEQKRGRDLKEAQTEVAGSQPSGSPQEMFLVELQRLPEITPDALRELAEKHGLTAEQALEAIKQL